LLRDLSPRNTQEYLKRGIIAAVFVSPQEITDNTVTLEVVEARMGELRIEEHKYFKKNRLRDFWKIKAEEILRYSRIKKFLDLMNRNPDREVKATLHAGEKPGTTDILLRTKTRFPLHLIYSFDNEGSISTGKYRNSLGFRHNNLLGLDDVLMAGYMFGKDFSGKYAYHNLPIGDSGTHLLYGYNESKAVPKKDFSQFGINSQAENISFSLYQDIFNAKGESLGELFLGFDAKDKTIKENAGTINRDRLRIINAGGNFVYRALGSMTYFSPKFSQGVDTFGASPNNNPLASRAAKSSFSKFNFDVQRRQSLPCSFQANLKCKTQFASTKLMPQETFYLGGMNSVRGYPDGDYSADNAATASGELLIPSFFIPQNIRLPYAKESLRDQVTVFTFLDYGHGERRSPLSTEKKSVDFWGVGSGIRLRLYDQVLIRLEWGFPVGDKPITESCDSYFYISIDFEDKLPEELKRIGSLIKEKREGRSE